MKKIFFGRSAAIRGICSRSKIFIPTLIAALMFGCGAKTIFAQASAAGVLYIPLIGITSVPTPLAIPVGGGSVTYHYAVKNFIQELPLSDIRVVDNGCSPVQFVTGDDNHDLKLDYNETWRYQCTTKLSTTTESTATATGVALGTTASHTAYAMVVIGSSDPPPLVSIVNVTKVAYPLSLPPGGGNITFTYKVNNPGVVPLSRVAVVDDKCSAMSGKLGDTNGNDLLDTNEVWIYNCTTRLSQTTTNTVSVTAFANGLRAIDSYALTVMVAQTPDSSAEAQPVPKLPETGSNPDSKIKVWEVLSGVLAALIVAFFFTWKIKSGRSQKASGSHVEA
jgi:hypothetical protein